MTIQKITIRDKDYEARPLTVEEIIAIIKSQELQKDEDEDKSTAKQKALDLEDDVLRQLFENPIEPRVFFESLGCKLKDIWHLTPEEMAQLMEVVAKANPTYAGMEKRVRTLMQSALTRLSEPASD